MYWRADDVRTHGRRRVEREDAAGVFADWSRYKRRLGAVDRGRAALDSRVASEDASPVLAASYKGFALLALAALIGCADQDPPRVGDVFLLPGDPAPPSLSADALLIDLADTERMDLCEWVDSLSRPELSDCPPAETYLSIFALELYCLSTTAEQRPSCQATVEDVAACAVAVEDCATTFDSPGACGVFVLDECRPDAPVG